MPYIGKSPLHGNYSKLDDFSGDFDGNAGTIGHSHNIESFTDNGSGDYTFTFAVPFKAERVNNQLPYVVVPSFQYQVTNDEIITIDADASERQYVRLLVDNHLTNAKQDVQWACFVVFGELENE